MGIAAILAMVKSCLGVTSISSTGKQILCMEDPQDQILVMKRSSFSVLWKSWHNSSHFFRANTLWKLRNTQLKGNTVGFCDIFSCFILELVS